MTMKYVVIAKNKIQLNLIVNSAGYVNVDGTGNRKNHNR